MAVLERVTSSSTRPFIVERRFVERGYGNIKRSIDKYKNASHVVPHVVLTDLDSADCAMKLRLSWNALIIPRSMLFRVAVHETESWLLGDAEGFARFASIPKNKIPQIPEEVLKPKELLVSLVRRCGDHRLATAIVPKSGSSVSIGPLYNEKLIPFVRNFWSVEAASCTCPSLRRLRERLEVFLFPESD